MEELVITNSDLVVYGECNSTTKKGMKCKNKCNKNYYYCKVHSIKHKFQKPEECSICMDSTSNIHTPLSCGHWIHKKCIIQWGKNECPICRRKINVIKHKVNNSIDYRILAHSIYNDIYMDSRRFLLNTINFSSLTREELNSIAIEYTNEVIYRNMDTINFILYS